LGINSGGSDERKSVCVRHRQREDIARAAKAKSDHRSTKPSHRSVGLTPEKETEPHIPNTMLMHEKLMAGQFFDLKTGKLATPPGCSSICKLTNPLSLNLFRSQAPDASPPVSAPPDAPPAAVAAPLAAQPIAGPGIPGPSQNGSVCGLCLPAAVAGRCPQPAATAAAATSATAAPATAATSATGFLCGGPRSFPSLRQRGDAQEDSLALPDQL